MLSLDGVEVTADLICTYLRVADPSLPIKLVLHSGKAKCSIGLFVVSAPDSGGLA